MSGRKAESRARNAVVALTTVDKRKYKKPERSFVKIHHSSVVEYMLWAIPASGLSFCIANRCYVGKFLFWDLQIVV